MSGRLALAAAGAMLAAMSAATRRDDDFHIPDFAGQSPRRGGRLLQSPNGAPNDSGPVVDTTRESKRARRRRLARAALNAGGQDNG